MRKKLDGLKIAQEIAKEHGGRCLSLEYINNSTNMLLECAEKHQWQATLHSVKDMKSWCLKCSGKEAYTLKDCKKIAKQYGGKCLSIKYLNANNKMHWECLEKHKWSADFNSIKNKGHWCPYCAKCKIDGLKEAQQIAKYRGGKCLSKKYKNDHVDMHWKCAIKHKWWARLNNIKNNHSWCPECANLQRAKSQTNSYILYHWKTGEELICQASYEKKVVEYLNINKINFRWQPKTFTTTIFTSKSKAKTYRPDLYLFSTKKWIEIKGYFREHNKVKWDWFHKEHKNSELWNKEKLHQLGIL